MVLLIIIPIKWLFHWEYTQHFQTNPYDCMTPRYLFGYSGDDMLHLLEMSMCFAWVLQEVQHSFGQKSCFTRPLLLGFIVLTSGLQMIIMVYHGYLVAHVVGFYLFHWGLQLSWMKHCRWSKVFPDLLGFRREWGTPGTQAIGKFRTPRESPGSH